MIKAVIFDLDGTLIDLPIDYKELFKEFSKILKTDKIQPITKTLPKIDGETKKRIFQVWDQKENSVLERATVKDEGMTIYREHNDKPKALVTMQGKRLVQKIMESLGLEFNTIVTREDTLERVEQLKIAAMKLNVSLTKILFVGNTEGDEEAAKNAACVFMRVK